MKYYLSSSKNSNNRSNKGYTLLELMVVVSIFSVLLVTSYRGLVIAKENLDLNRTAHQLEATLKECQSFAMYTGTYYKVKFQPAINRYQVFRETELINSVMLENIIIHNVNFTDNEVYFYKTGTPSMGGTITLKTKNGRKLYVIMTPVTARTRISVKPPENW
jgi:prepilin-type N-terminal cleavage/methylation domain-containing protein